MLNFLCFKFCSQIFLDPNSHTESLAALLAERADCRSRTGNLKGCIEDATQSLEIKPSAEAYMKRAMAYESLEKYV